MTLFQSPMSMLLFLAALALTLLGKVLKKGHTLSFFGGICFALCAVSVYVDGGTTQEVLILALIMLLTTFHRRGDGV
jgi:hypothetical protein